jgi:membrane protein YqaA with SNARE-associated domain
LAFVLCASVWAGCLAGNLAFVALIGRLGWAAKLADSPHLAVARDLLQRHGPIAGVMNTILPLPTVPLMVAAHVLKADETLIVLALAAGRAVRYVVLCSTILGGRSAYAYAKGQLRPPDADQGKKAKKR